MNSIPEPHTRAVNLRVREEVRVLIDRAAKAHGKTRSDVMIDAAQRLREGDFPRLGEIDLPNKV